jgi:hypothetical protein
MPACWRELADIFPNLFLNAKRALRAARLVVLAGLGHPALWADLSEPQHILIRWKYRLPSGPLVATWAAGAAREAHASPARGTGASRVGVAKSATI